jgi:hypothetical protein
MRERMKESEDKLSQQIKAAFEDYDDGLAADGWTELRKKHPEKESKKLPIWWLTGIAASLLVVAGLYFNQNSNTEKLILSANNSKKDTSVRQQIENNKGKLDFASASKATDEKNTIADDPNQKSNNLNENVASVKPFVAHQNKLAIAGTEKKPAMLNTNTTDHQPKSAVVMDNAIASVQTDNSSKGKIAVENNATAVVEKDVKPTNDAKPTKISIEEFLTEQSKILAATENKKGIKKNNTSTTTIDVFTGTFFNYHDDNEAKLSAGLGINANVKVTKNVILSFGAGISQNKVSYENKVPAQVTEAMFASKNNSLNAAPVDGFAYSATATNDVSFNGSMLSIDLPMVVKLYPTSKQDFYISTGINSSTYLSQKYTYNYSLSNFAVQNGTAQPQQQTEKSSLKGFDFANSAIIAIGINQNIGKNTLIFEPYYKPALSSMGDKNLRISSAGLNLKFNFNGNAKK